MVRISAITTLMIWWRMPPINLFINFSDYSETDHRGFADGIRKRSPVLVGVLIEVTPFGAVYVFSVEVHTTHSSLVTKWKQVSNCVL